MRTSHHNPTITATAIRGSGACVSFAPVMHGSWVTFLAVPMAFLPKSAGKGVAGNNVGNSAVNNAGSRITK
jgi:hypothetical protein